MFTGKAFSLWALSVAGFAHHTLVLVLFQNLNGLMEGHNEVGSWGHWKAGLIAQISKIALEIHRFEGLETDKEAPELV